MRGPAKVPTVAIEPLLITLDADQARAASIDSAERQIVLAPPGSGKTEVVAALLEALYEQGLEPRDEVMAISFSRAAVAALRRRAGRGDSPAPAIRTLDSLASRMLDEVEDQEWRHLSFDKRIARALQEVEAGAEVSDLSMLRHLIVDEVQDLVGVRARLVLALIDRLDDDAGFTLLGDPDQAIYGFQLANTSDLTSAELLARIRRRPDIVERRLRHQYRARTVEARTAATVLASRPSGSMRTSTVRTFLAQITSGGTVGEVGQVARRWTGSTAYLCRTNGQALMVARALREVGCIVETRASSDEMPVAAWIARTFQDVGTSVVRRAEVDDRLAALAPMGPDEAWRLLKFAEHDFRVSDRINLKRLRTAILRRNLPSELVGGSLAGSMVVSTIHRAKGLEFDNVVLVNVADLVKGDATEEDTSVAYVAATRSRDRLVTASIELPRGLRLDDRSGRWFLGGFKSWMTFGFEVRGGDTQPIMGGDDGPNIEDLPVGAAVTTEFDRSLSSLDFPVYRFVHEGRTVARTTEQFGTTLARRLGTAHKRQRPWPDVSGLVMESVETRAAPEVEDRNSGLVLSMRIGGMADFDWGRRG